MDKRFVYLIGLLAGLIAGMSACEPAGALQEEAYRQEILTWQQARIEGLMAPDSWLALAGLFWLQPGANSFGSDAGHAVVFPDRAPDTLGTFFLSGDSVFMQLLPGRVAGIGQREVNAYRLSGHASPPVVVFEDLSWTLIERSGKFGIRLWDAAHPNLQDTIHIDTYPIDPGWRLPATWVPDPDGRTMRVRNVLDMEMDMKTEGRLRFDYRGKSYELTALDGGQAELFMIFADATNGEQTYSAGRYLYVDRPDSTGRTYLDFNKAYNPPCAFTEFATCLLPPPENRLELAVTAGEKSYGRH